MSLSQLKEMMGGMVLGLEDLEIQIAELVAKRDTIYANAKTCGLNSKVLRQLVRERKTDPKAKERDALDAYNEIVAATLANNVAKSVAETGQGDIEHSVNEAKAADPSPADGNADIAQSTDTPDISDTGSARSTGAQVNINQGDPGEPEYTDKDGVALGS